MLDGLALVAGLDLLVRETTFFAASGFLLGGLDDLAVDLLYVAYKARHLAFATRTPTLDSLPARAGARRIAVFVAAWDESAVIGAMLDAALSRFDYPNYRLYVGTYPNDRATIDIVAAAAARDPRVRLVVGNAPGPTTKAGCLNWLWDAMQHDDAAEGRRTDAVLLHDAEDVVHPGELRVFDAWLDTHAVVQLPVLPLVDRGSRLVSGHYLDEFAESHGKQMVVRQAIGAGLPLSGVGCAIDRGMLDRIATMRGGAPFDASSLTEDYELGLEIARLGGSGILARVAERRGGPLVAVRAFFPGSLAAAIRQKARWMTGIALAGWDRVGWGRLLDWRDHWMRMRDRRAPIAVLVLVAAYLALVAGGFSLVVHSLTGVPIPSLPRPVAAVLGINAALLGWRIVMRMVFTGRVYGPVEALLSVPRMVVGNFIALLAARRAMTRYVGMLRGAAPSWEKTSHAFPTELPGSGAA